MPQIDHRRLPALTALLAAVFMIAAMACSDDSGLPEAMVRVGAPIESFEITKAAAKSPNATMIVVTGLRNGCEVFDSYDLRRSGDVFRLTISNLMNVDPQRACTDDYRTVTTSIQLDAPIEECKQYAVEVNGVATDVVFTYTPFMESVTKVCGS